MKQTNSTIYVQAEKKTFNHQSGSINPSSGCRILGPQAAWLQLGFCIFVLLHECSGATGHLNFCSLNCFQSSLEEKNHNENLFRSHIITFFLSIPEVTMVAPANLLRAVLCKWPLCIHGDGAKKEALVTPVGAARIRWRNRGSDVSTLKHTSHLRSLSSSSFRRWNHKRSQVRNNPPKKGEKVKPAEKSGNDLMHQTCAGAAGAHSSAIKLAAAQQGKEF